MSGSLGTATVMGAGAWGTAVAKVLADAGGEVRLWVRRPEVAEEINAAHTNVGYLPGVVLPAAVWATADPAEALDGVSTVVLGVPAQTMRTSSRGGAISPPERPWSASPRASNWERAFG